MITDQLPQLAPPGTRIPRRSSPAYRVENWSPTPDGCFELTYTGLGQNDAPQPDTKTITAQEIQAVFSHLLDFGELSRDWYEVEFPTISYRQPTNFAVLGGLLQYLGAARRIESGLYRKF